MDQKKNAVPVQGTVQKKKPTEKALKARQAYAQTQSAEERCSITRTRMFNGEGEGVHKNVEKKR